MTAVDDLVELYASPAAHRLYDEEVTELEHAVQCAALAVRDGASDHLTAAALLHDVGHLLLDDNVALTEELTVDHGHEAAGARFLAAHGFPPSVTRPIALHVDAKRYLCSVDADHLASLSSSSLRSLALQGGPMDDDETAEFRRRPGFADAIRVRLWDDRGKIRGLDVDDFGRYIPMLLRLLRR